jgi:hypothetical protein
MEAPDIQLVAIPWSRPGWSARRARSMNKAVKMALAMTAVVVAGVACGPAAVAPSSAVVTPTPAPSPSLQTATAGPTSSPNLLDTSTWTTYVSKRYGFSIAHPADWHEDPAEHDWTLAKDAIYPNSATEHFELPLENQGVGVSVWSVAVDPGTSLDSWLHVYCQKNNVDCTGIQDRAVAATMDGNAGTLVQFDDIPHALFLVDGRVYVIACWRPDDDPSVEKFSGSFRLVQAFLSTMHLLPGGPASSPPTPSPS